jgi:hypothetical protein
MGKVVKAILGGGDKPKASRAPVESAEAAARKAKRSRSALFETEGGVAGEELNPSGVERRNTLLGN